MRFKNELLFFLLTFISFAIFSENNIVPNGNFEEGEKFPYKWGILVKKYPGIKVLPSDARYKGRVVEGKNILWVERKDGGKCILFLLDENAPKYASISEMEGMTFSSEMIKLEPNKKYIMEVEAKSTGPEGIIFLKGYRKLTSGKFQERYRAPLHFHIKTDNKWRKFKRQFSIPFSDTKYGIVNLYAYGRRGKIWFDNVKIRRISK